MDTNESILSQQWFSVCIHVSTHILVGQRNSTHTLYACAKLIIIVNKLHSLFQCVTVSVFTVSVHLPRAIATSPLFSEVLLF